MKGGKVLVVEDDSAAAQYLTLALVEEGYDVRSVVNGVEALLAMEAQLPDLVISDLRMPEMDGLGLLTRVKQRWPALPFILVTVEEDVSTVVEAVQLGALNYLVKPIAPPALISAVGTAFSFLAGQSVEDQKLPEIVGVSRSIVEVRHLVIVAGRSGVNVLVTGETGTGKELVARAIHRCSKLSKGPFVAQNCGAIPQELFESQFFGHRRGAFTGADRDHVGVLERADGGVLFLDELESLSQLHQAKLLRVIDDGEVRPLGSSEARQVAVRFVAAANREPREMIATRELREDLYYRLCGFEIHLPPLKDRGGDVHDLARHFLGAGSAGITDEAREWLACQRWPGNVRQLQNALRGAQSVAAEGRIGLRHLQQGMAGSVSAGPREAESGAPARAGTLEAAEWEAVQRALAAAAGNRSAAARLLGIDRSTLRRKISRLKAGDHGGKTARRGEIEDPSCT